MTTQLLSLENRTTKFIKFLKSKLVALLFTVAICLFLTPNAFACGGSASEYEIGEGGSITVYHQNGKVAKVLKGPQKCSDININLMGIGKILTAITVPDNVMASAVAVAVKDITAVDPLTIGGALIVAQLSPSLATQLEISDPPPVGHKWIAWESQEFNWDPLFPSGQSVDFFLEFEFAPDVLDPGTEVTLYINDTNSASIAAFGTSVIPFSSGQIPTLSEWGLIFLALLLMAFGTVSITRKKLAMSGGTSASISMISPKQPLFYPNLYFRVLAFVLVIAVSGLLILSIFSGGVPLLDIVGTIVAAAIVAYIIHFVTASRSK